jgi:hypothetical protein
LFVAPILTGVLIAVSGPAAVFAVMAGEATGATLLGPPDVRAGPGGRRRGGSPGPAHLLRIDSERFIEVVTQHPASASVGDALVRERRPAGGG